MKSWRKYKRSGSYTRAVRKQKAEILKRAIEISKTVEVTRSGNSFPQEKIDETGNDIVIIESHSTLDCSENNSTENFSIQYPIECEYFDADIGSTELENNLKFSSHLRAWAIKHQITHTALKSLSKIINSDIRNMLPEDPRTLLKTPQEIFTKKLENGGLYWHHGLVNCLQTAFNDIQESKTISININMDGLPIFNSSKVEFWPILFNVTERPELPAMVIGIYSGMGKCHDIKSFLQPFVDETKEAMANGVTINSHTITVHIRCIICDSPARAYVKGVANFNSHHDCQKCCTIGEYSYISNTNIFPRTECEKRTDADFRRKMYGSHHKYDSPLLDLNIDMVEQFPIGDSLHLLHLGLMKRLLFGWRDGSFRNSNTKWRAKTTNDVSSYLIQCKMPAEFHRVVRGLDCLAHWKGTEYRTFLHYVGIIALRNNLTQEAYDHFLLIFCAVTILTSINYFDLLSIARSMIIQFIECFAEIYGEHHMTSNIHNLSHLVDEVERFGELNTFSAYPFENTLGKIKRLLRNGHRPLPQVAKRILEDFNCTTSSPNIRLSKEIPKYPILSKKNHGDNIIINTNDVFAECLFYSKIQFKKFCLGDDPPNSWLLTAKNEVFCVINIIFYKKTNKIKFCCSKVIRTKNLFTIPFESKYLNIHCADLSNNLNKAVQEIVDEDQIKCKLVCLPYQDLHVFIPLLHTL